MSISKSDDSDSLQDIANVIKKEVKPEQMVQILQDRLTLVEGDSEKQRQRIIDQIFQIVLEYAKLATKNDVQIISLKDEISRLQKLCKDNKIDPSPPKPKKPNRTQRRKAERDAKKAVKKQKK